MYSMLKFGIHLFDANLESPAVWGRPEGGVLLRDKAVWGRVGEPGVWGWGIRLGAPAMALSPSAVAGRLEAGYPPPIPGGSCRLAPAPICTELFVSANQDIARVQLKG